MKIVRAKVYIPERLDVIWIIGERYMGAELVEIVEKDGALVVWFKGASGIQKLVYRNIPYMLEYE